MDISFLIKAQIRNYCADFEQMIKKSSLAIIRLEHW